MITTILSFEGISTIRNYEDNRSICFYQSPRGQPAQWSGNHFLWASISKCDFLVNDVYIKKLWSEKLQSQFAVRLFDKHQQPTSLAEGEFFICFMEINQTNRQLPNRQPASNQSNQTNGRNDTQSIDAAATAQAERGINC